MGGTGLQTARFIGLERQPFLVEAFIAHVYYKATRPSIPLANPAGPYDEIPLQLQIPLCAGAVMFDEGGRKWVDAGSDQTTIAVVQIVNPFDQRIDLRDYVIELFGQPVDLAHLPGIDALDVNGNENYWLYPGSEEQPISNRRLCPLSYLSALGRYLLPVFQRLEKNVVLPTVCRH